MYFVGIDISKFKHDCAIIDELGDVITSSWSFNNDCEGFSLFRDLLNALDGEKKIGFESTGHYGHNLKLFLESNNFSFMEFNPLLIARFVRGKSLRKTKSDTLDAQSIAQYLMTVEYKPYPPSFYHMDQLKSLTRFRDSLVRQHSRQLVELTNILDKVFPEFKPFFDGKFSVTALYILSHYQSPEKIANMNAKSYEALRKKSRGKFSMVKFAQLKALAKNTVGRSDDFLLKQMEITIDIENQLDAKIDEIETQIAECIRGLNPPVLTIPGIGELTAAVILSEYGDISRFEGPAQMLSFAGLEPGYYQSGLAEHGGHMVKHGSSYLRYVLLNAAQMLIVHNTTFYEYYHKKRTEGKHHRVALSHVAKKLVRIIFYLEKNNTHFDSDKLR